ncbi:hypothetical protein BMF77_01063 [Dolichospermum sp. UHCC 0315A]|nr:hypothetical protein BMF77_01063 [Dolichospermum sp. UHCC 0315A]
MIIREYQISDTEAIMKLFVERRGIKLKNYVMEKYL